MLGTSVFRAYRDHADEAMTIFLTPPARAANGAGRNPSTPQDVTLDGPIAALTRATVKPSVALKFWGQEPDVSRAIGEDPNVMFKIGIGEVPWMQQVTFSIWPDARDHGQVRPRMTGRMPAPSRPSATAAGSAKNYTPASASTRWKGEWEGVTPDLTHRPERQMTDPIEVAAE
jgi:spheroidene monooxygenase